MTRSQRAAIEQEIERLIGLLDFMDGDADLEPDDIEPDDSDSEPDHNPLTLNPTAARTKYLRRRAA